MTRRWLPGAADAFCIALALPIVLLHASFTHDTWWHLAQGRLALETRGIPAVESFSFTAAGTPLASHSWLYDVALGALERAGGTGLVEVSAFVLIALAFRLVHEVARAHGAAGAPALAAVLVFARGSTWFLNQRPQLWTYAFFAALLLAWLRFRQGRSRVLLLAPVLLAAWANLHGGFVLGLAFLLGAAALEVLRRERRRAATLAAVAFAGALACCLNPRGPWIYADALANTPAFDPIHLAIDEWRPPDLSDEPLLAPLAVAAIALAALAAGGVLLEEGTLVALAFLAAFRAWRNVPLAGIVAAPILAAWLTRIVEARAPAAATLAPLAARVAATTERLLGAWGSLASGVAWILLAGAALATAAIARPPDVLSAPAVSRRWPVAACSFLERARLRGHPFHSYAWGGFLEWRLPGTAVFIDSRMVPFRGEVYDDYVAIATASPGWRERVARRGVEWALVRRDERLAPVLEADPGWRCVHADDLALVFARRDGPNRDIAPAGSSSR